MIGEENEKYLLFIKMFVVSVTYIIIGLCLLLFIGVSKVKALQTYGPNTIAYGLDTSGTSTQIANYTWVNMPVDNNYINVGFGGYNGAFQSHILIEMEFLDSQVGNGYKSVAVNAFINGVPQSGVSGNCPNSGNKANCDVYFNGVLDSNSSNLVLQLKLTGTYWTFYTTRIRVSGSITIDETTSSLNNASFNNGINSINSNISGSTQSITQNNNNNTQSIINNQNANSQAQIEAIEKQNIKCDMRILNQNDLGGQSGNLINTGTINASSQSYVSKYIPINENTTYNLVYGGRWTTSSYCLYGEDKSLISCTAYGGATSMSITPLVEGFIRFTYAKNDTTSFSGQYCYNYLDKQNEQQQQQNDYLMDTTPADANIISGIQVTADTPISSLLTIPIRLIQSFLGNINGQCGDYSFGSLYGTELKLKCSDIRYIPTLLGNAYTIIDYLMCFFMIYNIFQLLVTAWNTITTLKDDFHNIYETKTWGNGEGFDY